MRRELFVDKEGNKYYPEEVIFCDIDTPGPQFLGHVTLESFNKTNCIDNWTRVYYIPGYIPGEVIETKKIAGMEIIKGVKYHKES